MEQHQGLMHEARGTAQKVAGRVAEALGRLFHSHSTEAKGAAEELRGETNATGGKVGERIESGVERAQDKVQSAERNVRDEMKR